MNRARVLEVTKSTGGVAEYVRWLAHGLDREKFALTVACLSENGPEFAAELGRIPGVSAFSLEMNRYQVDPFSDARVALRLREVIIRQKFDLVHAHASKPGFLARFAALGSGTPVIFSPHCFAFHAGTGRAKARILAALEAFAARFLTARIMTVARGEEELALRFGVGYPGLFTTVHSGLDAQAYRRPVQADRLKASLGIPPQAPLVGAVGRLSEQKAPLDFVRMAAQVHAMRPEVHFIWIGTGPLEADVRTLAASLGLEGVFHLPGQRSDIPELLHTLDCFALTSLWEGFPLVVLEAMAAGVAVVATDILGTREAIQSGESGLLVPPADAQAMAKAVISILDHPQQAEGFRQAATRRIETEFTRERMLQGVTGLYQDMINTTGKRN